MNAFLPKGYRIKENGEIYSPAKKRLLKKTLLKNGYYAIGIKNKLFYLHRLLAQSFIPNPFNKKCINHKDGNKLNNNIDNLEWCTYKENNIHGFKNGFNHGTSYYGEDNNAAKVTNEQVLQIRKTKGLLKDIGKQFGLSVSQVWSIKNFQSWSHI